MFGFIAGLSYSCAFCQGGALLFLFPGVPRGLDTEVLSAYLGRERVWEWRVLPLRTVVTLQELIQGDRVTQGLLDSQTRALCCC